MAHNVDAIDALLAKVNEQCPTLTHRDLHVVLALSRDKKASSVAQSVLNIVGGDASRIVCVDATNVTHRALPAATLRGIVGDLAIEGRSPHLKEEMTVEQGD